MCPLRTWIRCITGKPVQILVRLHTTLQIHTPSGLQRQVTAEVPEGACLSDLLAVLPLPAVPQDEIILVCNHKVRPPDHPLQPGDIVDLIPALSGGSQQQNPNNI